MVEKQLFFIIQPYSHRHCSTSYSMWQKG